MAQVIPFASQASDSSLHPASILDLALEEYRKNTGNDLLSHPLSVELQRCDSVDGILAILQRQANTFEQSRDSSRGLMKWISPSVHILYSFSAALGDGVSLVFPPAKSIFTGIGILLAAAKDVSASNDVLSDIFVRIEDFFKRFKIYSRSLVNAELAEVLVNAVVKVLKILSIATKEIEQSRAKRYIKKLAGRKDIENALGELESVIQGEHYTATTQVLQDTSQIRQDVEAVSAAIQQMASKRGEEEWKKMREETRKWFSPPDPSTNHNIAWKVYHAGSATWLFGHGVFEEWMSTGSLLWVHGKPGSGKSIICSAIIQHIIALCKAGQASIVYFYFDFRDKEKQNARNLVTSLLIQLSAFSDPCCDIIHRVYSAHGNGARQPTNDVLTNCLREMLAVVAEDPIYIVMDALDECPDHSGWPTAREEVLVVLRDLVGLHLPNLRICVTSRPEVDIKSVLNQLTIHAISLHDEREQQQGIADYVRSIVNSDVKMREWPDEDKELVTKVLSERADGMFRWVVCQLETLRRSVRRNLCAILEKLPTTLDETYERILKEISEDNREDARRLLHCLAVAIRPLRVEELAEILAFDFDDLESGIPKFRTDWRLKDQEEAVLSTCSSLISVVDGHDNEVYPPHKCRVVQFAHFSVKEFLISDRLASVTGDVSRYHILPGPAHTILAQVCLGFLLQVEGPLDRKSANGPAFPLARYAPEHWVAHAQFEGVSSRLKDGMRSLFNPNEPHLVTWLQIFDIDPESDGYDFGEPNPLYYASLCGFHDLVEHLVINHPQLVNTIYGVFDTPLLAALSRKHFRVAEFLLQHGGNVEIRGKGGQTPLHIAITDCWRVDTVLTETTSFLLKHGADVNSRDGDLCTPLHLAALWSEPGEAHFLLEHGAEIEARNREGRTPLHLVFKDGPDGMFDWGLDHQLSFVRLFLEHGTNVNAQDQHGYTPLYLAKLQESWEVVRILLENGAILDTKTENNSQPSLHLLLRGIFSHGDDLDLARLLLERGAKVNARWQGGETPLHLAVQWEFYEIAGVLLEYGADPDAEDDSGRTPLHLLLLTDQMFSEDSVQGLGLLRSLLENGADVNSQNGAHTSPLHLAMELELYDVAQILLEHGAEPNMKNNKGKTPLHLLLEREYDDHDDADDVLVVGRLLLESGADVNAKDEDNTTPLHLVSNHHTPEIAQVILDHANAKKDRRRALLHLTLEECGADTNTQNKDLTTHLHSTCYFGRPETVRDLLDHGENANAENTRGETPLHLVSRGRYDNQECAVVVVQLLLRHGANVNAEDKGHMTSLQLASYYGRLAVARVLLDNGARVNAENELGQTPLHLVTEGNQDDVSIVRLLLERGADVNARDTYKESPLHLASNYGKLAIGRVLLDHGADVDAENFRGQTPLHMLSPRPWRFDDVREFTGILVDGGADVNARDRDQETPLHLAYRRNRLDIAECLLARGADGGAENYKGETPLQLASAQPMTIE